MFNKIIYFIKEEKNFYKVFFIIAVFLISLKLPALISTDIQPWDEGMYATRVLSIHVNGDSFDQSRHSIGGFYSGSHPPLLIWAGYLVTSVTGINSIALKMIPFVLSIFCVMLIMLLGRKLISQLAGITAALFFTSNIIFEVFSVRFQFDIPYTFFILLSFFLFITYLENQKIAYNIAGGIVFGLCLMTKILVGFYIPLIIFVTLIILRRKINYKISDLIIFSLSGIIIALPWHLYMIIHYGKEFTDYFLFYHIYERALFGVDSNIKNSGPLYHINYMLSIIPYSILAFPALFSKLKDYKKMSPKDVFLCVWFILGFIIITIFRTKLEVYVLLILTPGALLIGYYIERIKDLCLNEKFGVYAMTLFNMFWFFSYSARNDIIIREKISGYGLLLIPGIILLVVLILSASYFLSRKVAIGKFFYIFTAFFFISLNTFYTFNVPGWENSYKISDLKTILDASGRSRILYTASYYRFNPQFSFYFNGLNDGWKNEKYNFELLDTKYGNEAIKTKLRYSAKEKCAVIVERDNINRSVYEDSRLFIPDEFKLIYKTYGYELYFN